MDLGYLLRRGITEHANEPALSGPDRTVCYAELERDARRLANALLAMGLRRGDRVLVLLDNRVEYAVVDVALAYAGLVRVALNVRLQSADFRYIAADCAAELLITQERYDDVATEIVTETGVRWVRLDGEQRLPSGAHGYRAALDAARTELPELPDMSEELAWISYTSGTTGRPKGVMLSHRALVQVAVNIMLELGTETTSQAILLVQPLSHGAGYFVLPYLACGGHVHIRHGFDAEEVVELSKRERISTLKLVPTMLLDMLEVPGSPEFRNIIYGAAPISEPVLGQAMDRYGPVLSQLYGQSEAPMTITYLAKSDHQVGAPQIRSAGRPWRSVRVDVVDQDGVVLPPGELGEIVVTGQHAMTGYYGRPEQTAEVLRDGRIWTRDMGLRDDAGYIYLRGRRDEMINSGGFNIAPKEVEDVLTQFPGVREAAAIGVPDPRWGQIVRAYVVPEAGATVEEGALVEFCKPRLGFRRPRSVVLLPGLPRTSYGKVDRLRLVNGDRTTTS